MRSTSTTRKDQYCVDYGIHRPSPDRALGPEEAFSKPTQVLVEVKRLVLGIGNTIMGDDGVGIYVARMVRDRVQSRADLQIKELGASGFKLVEEMLGYDEVVIVDSYAAGETDTGQIREFSPEDFEDTLHASSPHGANFATALELYRHLRPDRIPKSIRIFTVGICPTDSFRETLSDRAQEAALRLTEMIVTRIERSDPSPTKR